MLKSIHLTNFTIASDVKIEFEQGMTAITGETGAGKSIMVDALKLLSGQRADEGWIREGQDKSMICAVFDISKLPQARQSLEEAGYPEDDEIILKRSLSRGGRTRNYINGNPVNLVELQEISKNLLEICSQHAHIQLLERRHQLVMVDSLACAYAADGPELYKQVSQSYRAWRNAVNQLEEVNRQIEENQTQRELLGYHLEELDALEPVEDEYEELSAEHKRLSGAGEHQNILFTTAKALEGSHRNPGAITLLGDAVMQLEGANLPFEEAQTVLKTLKDCKIEMEEAVGDLTSCANGIEDNPARLEEVNRRVELYFRLGRKHMVDPGELCQVHEEVANKLENLPTADDLEPLKQAVEQTWLEFESAALTLRELRKSAGGKLSEEVRSVLQAIGLDKSKVAVDITPADPSSRGMDSVELLFSANVGQTPKALAKVASGGELSRVALAFQVIEAEHASMPTVIFDEVDVGISGDAARKVGDMLARLGESSQCVVITHQAPVAKAAHHHLYVSKEHGETETKTKLTVLDEAGRAKEMVRLTGVEV